ncbi:hypothetical protein SNEBB_006628 [Seison nebaliae]|nr:hypothetical protein SNEBB_006628 [Seison nebaliae]
MVNPGRSNRKVAAMPDKAKKKKVEKTKNPMEKLFHRKKVNFGIGQSIQPKRDLTHFVRWPTYVRLQRKKRIIMKRLKTPPSIFQFQTAMEKQDAKTLTEFIKRHYGESKIHRKSRLLEEAKSKSIGQQERNEMRKTADGRKEMKKLEKKEQKAVQLKKKKAYVSGVNEVTKMIMRKKATLVVIAHDVEPIETVLHLPGLCQKMDIPYCIHKGKALLGSLVGRKTCTTLAFIHSNFEQDRKTFLSLQSLARKNFNDRDPDERKKWGPIILGPKTTVRLERQEKRRLREEKRLNQ